MCSLLTHTHSLFLAVLQLQTHVQAWPWVQLHIQEQALIYTYGDGDWDGPSFGIEWIELQKPLMYYQCQANGIGFPDPVPSSGLGVEKGHFPQRKGAESPGCRWDTWHLAQSLVLAPAPIHLTTAPHSLMCESPKCFQGTLWKSPISTGNITLLKEAYKLVIYPVIQS